MIGVLRRVQADRPPEPGHPVQCPRRRASRCGPRWIAACGGAARTNTPVCSAAVGDGQPEARRSPGGSAAAGWPRRPRARAAVPAPGSSAGAGAAAAWRRSRAGGHGAGTRYGAGGGLERAHQPGRAAQPGRRPGPGWAGEPEPFLVHGAGLGRCRPRCRRAGRAGWLAAPVTAWCQQCMPEIGSGWTGKVRFWCTPVSLHQIRWLSGSLDAYGRHGRPALHGPAVVAWRRSTVAIMPRCARGWPSSRQRPM